MQVIERAVTPNGVKIQLEDWREHNTEEHTDLYGLTIAAYPKAKRSSYYGFVRYNEPFRLAITMNKYRGYTNEMVLDDFESLKSGDKTLEDLSDHYYKAQKDKYYMGLINSWELRGERA